MAITLVFCSFNALFFIGTGALPVAMFFGLDFALLYGAFWLSYRSARARELIDLSPVQLRICKVSPSGQVRESRYNPFWTRLDIDRHEEFGITALAVVGEGHRTPVGTFLGPDERESFASAFGAALAGVKRKI